MQQQTIRRLLLAGVFTAAGIAGAVAFDQAAAQAADHHRPAAAEQPGGLLGHQLPAQASDRAREVVDQVAPEPKCDQPADEPTAPPEPPKVEPEPDRSDPPPTSEPAPDPVVVAPADPILDVPPVEVPPVVVPVPTQDPIVITLPATDPAPLPLPQLPVVLPGSLPVLIGPAPAVQPAPAAEPGQMEPAAAVAALKVPDCADRPDDAVNVNRDAIRQLIANLTEPAASPRVKPAPDCPGTPGNPIDGHSDCASTTATNSGHNGANSASADLADSTVAPALVRLEHARPRSHIPAGRHTAIEPGPA